MYLRYFRYYFLGKLTNLKNFLPQNHCANYNQTSDKLSFSEGHSRLFE